MSSPTTLQLLLVLVVVVGLAATTTAAPGVLGGGKGHGGVLSTPVHRLKPDVRVSKLGAGADVVTVATIAEAVNLAEKPRQGHFIIYVMQGTYDEHIVVKSADVVLLGDGMGRTIITGRLSNKTGHDVKASATLTVGGARFLARDVTIRNTAGDPDDHQAVALLVESNQSVFYRCQIQGYQDTLMANNFLQFYRECEISGTVDFIFGDAKAVFQDSHIYARRPAAGHDVVVTPQGRFEHDGGSGFVFQNCSVTTSPGESLEGVQTFLGRPWKDHARVVYMLCSISSIVDAAGWVVWDKNHPEQPVKGGAAPGHEGHIYYGEYQNHGIDTNVSHPVEWTGFYKLSEADAKKFTARRFIHGREWLGGTGVPHYLGLAP